MIQSLNLSLPQKFHKWTPSPAKNSSSKPLHSYLLHVQLPILSDKDKKSWTHPSRCLETLSSEKRITLHTVVLDTLEIALKMFRGCSLSFVR